MTPFGHLRHSHSQGARVADLLADVSVQKTQAIPCCTSWLYFYVLGHGRVLITIALAGVIFKKEAIQKQVDLEELQPLIYALTAWPSLRGLDVTNVTSTGTRNLWLLVAFLCLCGCVRLPTFCVLSTTSRV